LDIKTSRTSAIARAMGKTKSYLYYNFNDKEEILLRLLRNQHSVRVKAKKHNEIDT